MPSEEEKKHRKELWQGIKKEQLANEEAVMPISKNDLKSLFDHLDEALVNGCDHTNKYTVEFLQENNLPEEQTVKWLVEHGGYCDCEVLANVEDEWG